MTGSLTDHVEVDLRLTFSWTLRSTLSTTVIALLERVAPNPGLVVCSNNGPGILLDEKTYDLCLVYIGDTVQYGLHMSLRNAVLRGEMDCLMDEVQMVNMGIAHCVLQLKDSALGVKRKLAR